ncbi:MAG TPA: MoaD/ThiS family protein [Syntrophobacteraceae bacterium]|nr:MoaD/ThiS family protein [Syntrophobacteraceae bacterium]
MALQVRLGATLRTYVHPYDGSVGYEMVVPPGTTVRELVRRLKIPEAEVRLIFVNGVSSGWETVLAGDERVGLFPPVGGG